MIPILSDNVGGAWDHDWEGETLFCFFNNFHMYNCKLLQLYIWKPLRKPFGVYSFLSSAAYPSRKPFNFVANQGELGTI